ncbi:hypothetical protein OG233_08635 [Streptomyces sp. NBC_01218]|nr:MULTISPECIES: hypothetical protein [unclassified Streptomyces]WEH39545.1 hypothetical protein PZB77_08465 [Streptomyces sp. AM 2-1-1]WSQ51237.1 hypothetical protein OG233_08635 [Streptomyces sp. NBC_01218]
MLALVAALLLFGILLGPVAHLPVELTLVFAAAIGCWLIGFAVRERRSH